MFLNKEALALFLCKNSGGSKYVLINWIFDIIIIYVNKSNLIAIVIRNRFVFSMRNPLLW